MNERKSIYLQVAVLVAVLAFFLYSYLHRPDESFKTVYNRANSRLDSIASEVAKSQMLIQQAVAKLDAIQDSIAATQQKQQKSNISVGVAEATLKRQLQVKEKELSTLKSAFQKTKAEKDLYREQLDSLAETIGD